MPQNEHSIMNKLYSLLVLFIFFSACKEPTSAIDGYSKHNNGFYYKLLAIGDAESHPNSSQALVTEAVMKTLSDSIFWDTKHDSENGLFIDLSQSEQKYSINPYFSKAVVGDSISFYVNPTYFFKEYFKMDIPTFCKKDSLIKMDIKIVKVISQEDYKALKLREKVKNEEDRELQELQQIDDYLKSTKLDVTPDANGIYWIDKEESSFGEVVAWGKRITIEFQGYYLDGRPISQGAQTMEYIYGTPDQTTTGLNIVIGTLKNGEIAKIILPSRLAFGEKGSTNSSIKPYTPLLFEVKITDVKTINL